MSTELAKEKGLYDGDGFLFARGKGGILRYGRGKHVLVCAPSRSGKGVGFVIPNLLTWRGSAFAIDPKGELAHFTNRHRREVLKQETYVLDPCRVSGQPRARFNPLDWLDDSHDFDGDLAIIAEALMPDNSGTAQFWNKAAQDLLQGIVMYQFAIPDERRTLGRTIEILNAPEGEWKGVLRRMASCDGGDAWLNTKVREKANWFESLHEEHKQYHRGTCQYHLAWLGLSAAREMVAASDFDMRAIKEGRVTVYVCVPPLNTSVFEGFTRLLSMLAIKATMLYQLPPSSKEPPILLMLDEFATTVGRMKVFDDAFTNIAGFGGRFAIILQTIDQLQSLFPEKKGNQSWKTLYENAGLRLFFDAQSDTASFVSDRLGVTTVNQIAPTGGPRQVQRKLLFPNEVEFPTDKNGRHIPDAAFAFVEGWPPLRARRLCSYRDAEFSRLYDADSAAPVYKPDGLPPARRARLGYGAGVLTFHFQSEAIPERKPLPEPPEISESDKLAYIQRFGF